MARCTLNWWPLHFMVKSEYFPVCKMCFITGKIFDDSIAPRSFLIAGSNWGRIHSFLFDHPQDVSQKKMRGFYSQGSIWESPLQLELCRCTDSKSKPFRSRHIEQFCRGTYEPGHRDRTDSCKIRNTSEYSIKSVAVRRPGGTLLILRVCSTLVWTFQAQGAVYPEGRYIENVDCTLHLWLWVRIMIS